MKQKRFIILNTFRRILFTFCVVFIGTLSLFAQGNFAVTGTVTDTNGETLPGVNVMIKGTKDGVVANAEGKYSINVSGNDAVLVFSFVGFSTQEIPVGEKRSINVVMIEGQELDEVVVVGYGTQKRKNFTGSVSTVDVANSPVALSPRTNAMDILRGTVTGTIVSREEGAGSEPSIEIHGQKSVNSPNSNPLVVVDGMIYMGDWRSIDPSTIENMSVLKDATSLAAYGSQAANGVIMITTKKGKLGKPMISFDGSLSVANKAMTPKMLHPETFVDYKNIEYGGGPESWMYTRNYERYERGETTDWWDYATQTGTTQKYALSVSGATEKFNYYTSISHTDQKGIVIGDQYKTENINIRLQNDITDWLQVGTQVQYSYMNWDGIAAGQSNTMSPYANPYRPDGVSLEKAVNDIQFGSTNPVWNTLMGIDDYDRKGSALLKGHVLLKAPWIKGLNYRMNISYMNDNYKHYRFTHEQNLVAGNDGEERYSEENIAKQLPKATGYNDIQTYTSYVWDHILNYSAQFGKHFVDASAVYTRDEYTTDIRTLTGTDFETLGNTLLGYNGLHFATVQKVNNNIIRKANIGYLGRLNYNFDERYHLTASIRRDGSSVFGADKKWGVFPAVGAAWTASRENFMKNIDAITFLKLKASWGKNGNQSLNPYGSLSTINLGRSGSRLYTFDNSHDASWGEFITQIGNSTLGWETTTAFNTGFEIGLLNDRIRFELDAYKSQTTDQIFNRTIPVVGNGFKDIKATMGQVDNWGIEFTLHTVNIQNQDLRWTSMLNFSLNRNKLVDLYGDGKDDIGSSLFLGKSLGVLYGYKVIGIVQEDDAEYIAANSSAPGNPKFANIDGSADGKITLDSPERPLEGDRTILGYNKENFRMNMEQTLNYKNWELYALFTGTFSGGGYGMADNIEAYTNAHGLIDNTEPWWTPENKSNKYPRIKYTGGNYRPIMSYGFVRLQNLSLSYNFRQRAIKDWGIHNLRAYISAKNLFTLTNWEGGDPEARQKYYTAMPAGFNPLERTFMFGLNITF